MIMQGKPRVVVDETVVNFPDSEMAMVPCRYSPQELNTWSTPSCSALRSSGSQRGGSVSTPSVCCRLMCRTLDTESFC